MSLRWRWIVFTLACIGLLPFIIHVVVSMPEFGKASSAYGDAVNALGPTRRNVTNMVAAVNFDFRGLDTLGEESMLLCAVTGAVLLLRGKRGEKLSDKSERRQGRAQPKRADATVLLCRSLTTIVLLFGVYIVLHGTVTPGGGFQGGVVAASGLVLVYLGEGYPTWRKIARSSILGVLEGGGTFAFVAAAIAPMLWRRPALANVLPLGTFKDLFSGGLMVIVNAAVGIAVFGGFGLLALEFLEETRSPEGDPVPDEED